MQKKIFKNKTKRSKYYREYSESLNYLFNFSSRELDVLALIFKLNDSWPDIIPKDVVDTRSRKYIMTNTYINKNNLSKYIKKFKAEGILVKTENGWEIDSFLIPDIENETYVTYIIELENE